MQKSCTKALKTYFRAWFCQKKKRFLVFGRKKMKGVTKTK